MGPGSTFVVLDSYPGMSLGTWHVEWLRLIDGDSVPTRHASSGSPGTPFVDAPFRVVVGRDA